MQEKILTIIIPMYNSAKYINKCLDSLIIAGTEGVGKDAVDHGFAEGLGIMDVEDDPADGLEVIVVDDGSTDGCGVLAGEYVKKYPGTFRLIHKENGGHGSAVNMGVKAANGVFIKVLDADDWFVRGSLSGVLEELRYLRKADVVLCGYEIFDIRNGGREIVEVPHPMEKRRFRKGTGNGEETRSSEGTGSGDETGSGEGTRSGEETGSSKETRNGGETGSGGKPGGFPRGRYYSLSHVLEEWKRYKRLFCIHGMIYRREFYLGVEGEIPEGVFYDDAFYVTHYAAVAERIASIRRVLYVYRVGDAGQSVSNRTRVGRMGDLEKVIHEMCRQKKKLHENETRKGEAGKTDRKQPSKRGAGRYKRMSTAGEEYWYRKTVSACADYLITALLRMDDRRKGRVEAAKFTDTVREMDAKLYSRIRKKYVFLRTTSRLGLSEGLLQKGMKMNGPKTKKG